MLLFLVFSFASLLFVALVFPNPKPPSKEGLIDPEAVEWALRKIKDPSTPDYREHQSKRRSRN